MDRNSLTAMNDREIIEHWALREALIYWLVAVCLSGLVAIGTAVTAWRLGSGWLWLAAGEAVALASLCIWRMRRIWARLDYLEQFL
jgi:hypothetical protein